MMIDSVSSKQISALDAQSNLIYFRPLETLQANLGNVRIGIEDSNLQSKARFVVQSVHCLRVLCK